MLSNKNEYTEPLIYDAEYGSYQGDFELFLNLIDQGKVLDLACGTGRLTIPLALRDFKVTGLDESEAMLSRAREKSMYLDINWKKGDISDFAFGESFDLITMAGNSFQTLLTNKDQALMLRCVKKHLKLSGIFAFDTRNPKLADLQSTSDFEHWHSFKDFAGESVKVYGKQKYNPDQQVVTYTTKRVWGDHETLTEIKLRYTAVNDLKDTLHKTGFKLTNLYGDYKRNTYSDNALSIIVVCTSET